MAVRGTQVGHTLKIHGPTPGEFRIAEIESIGGAVTNDKESSNRPAAKIITGLRKCVKVRTLSVVESVTLGLQRAPILTQDGPILRPTFPPPHTERWEAAVGSVSKSTSAGGPLVIAAGGGTSLIPTPTITYSRTQYSNPIPLGRFWTFSVSDWVLYALRQACK